MAGGGIILLGLFSQDQDAPIAGRSLATGMHGGTIYVREYVPEYQLADNLLVEKADDEDRKLIEKYVRRFCEEFDEDIAKILDTDFLRIKPKSHRPYGNLYVG